MHFPHVDLHDSPYIFRGVARFPMSQESFLCSLLRETPDSAFRSDRAPRPKLPRVFEFLKFVKGRLGDVELWTDRGGRELD